MPLIFRYAIAGAAALASLAGCRGGATIRPDAPGLAALLPALAGEWAGVLEYSDYGTGERVQLPTTLSATIAGGELQLAFAYREPSGITLNAGSVHRALPDGRRYVMGTDTLRAMSVAGFGRPSESGHAEGTATFTGTTMENDTVVPARHTIILRRDSLIIRKETRDPPTFRNEYRLRRAGARMP